MKRFVFLLIGIMMAGGMAAAETTDNDNTTIAPIPVGADVMVPVSEGAKEVVFDVEGIEITAQAELEAVEGGRPVRYDPGESVAYSRGETDCRIGPSDRDVAERVAKYLDQRTAISTSVSVGWSSPGINVGYDIYPDISPSITVSGGFFSVKFKLRER